MDDDLWGDIDDSLLIQVPLTGFENASETKVTEVKIVQCAPEDNPGQGRRLKRSLTETPTTAAKSSTVDRDLDTKRQSLSPLHKYRHGYLWVSDLTAQCWCEQQLVYNFTMPGEVEEKPEMSVGTDLHLARELEVQDVVKVKVTSDEDIFAIKVLNLNIAVKSLLSGAQVVREIPIFGAPFSKDICLMGMIDELRCDQDTMNIDLFEFKTRMSPTLPSRAQKDTHKMQVLLYKQLFDELVLGVTSKESLSRHFQLDLCKRLGDDVCQHIHRDHVKHESGTETLDTLLDSLLSLMQSVVPCISQTFIEYCHQESKDTIAIEAVTADSDWLPSKFSDGVTFWQGDREPRGVDIEEAWKCGKCNFVDVCEWRLRKQEECAQTNSVRLRKP